MTGVSPTGYREKVRWRYLSQKKEEAARAPTNVALQRV